MCANSDRRRLAAEQAKRWAYEAADDGEYLEAISWLRALEVIEGSLPQTLAILRRRYVTAFGSQMERLSHRTVNPVPRAAPGPDRSVGPTLTPPLGTAR